jgi:hypothetical protein
MPGDTAETREEEPPVAAVIPAVLDEEPEGGEESGSNPSGSASCEMCSNYEILLAKTHATERDLKVYDFF